VRRLFLVILLLGLWAPAARAWTWPVQGPVLQGFSYDQAHPYAVGQHRGIDIGSPGGVPVLAPATGTVTFAGSVPASGPTVTIAAGGGLAVTLTHLGSVSVDQGATVAEGAAIGTVGQSGTSELGGPYVHLGIRVASDPNGYLDPLSFLPSASAPAPASRGQAPATAPAPQQVPAASAPAAVPDSASTAASSGAVSPSAPGPPAAGRPAPVEVPAGDFAPHAVAATPNASPSLRPVAAASTRTGRLESGRAATIPTGRPARVALRDVGDPPAPARTDASRAATGHSAAPIPGDQASVAHSRAISRPVPTGAGVAATLRSAPVHREGLDPSRSASRRRRSAPIDVAVLGTVALLALVVFVIGAAVGRRRRMPPMPRIEQAIVLHLPVARCPDALPEEGRLAA
jgi:hypothetical protein